jgi:hypothetical protein
MEKFQLSVLFKIIGIGSASGLVFYENSLYLISDSSTYLYQYGLNSLQLHKIALTQNPADNIEKKWKPDFESITQKGNKLFIIGSGSTENRNTVFSYHLKTKKVKEKNIALNYKRLKEFSGISNKDLNIEGTLFYNDHLYHFQRGNGANAKNGIFIIEDKAVIDNPKIEFIPFDLPKINNIEATFTDAILVENKIYFLATAEDTTSTYDDGEVLGSLIGRIDCRTMKIDFTEKISDTQKFEGVTFYKKSTTDIEFLLCEDNDSEELVSSIYCLKLTL